MRPRPPGEVIDGPHRYFLLESFRVLDSRRSLALKSASASLCLRELDARSLGRNLSLLAERAELLQVRAFARLAGLLLDLVSSEFLASVPTFRNSRFLPAPYRRR